MSSESKLNADLLHVEITVQLPGQYESLEGKVHLIC